MVIFSFEYQRFSTAFGNLVVQPPFMCSTAGSHCRNGRQNVCSLGQKRWVQPSAEASKVERKTYANMGLKIWELPLFSKDYHHFFQFNVHILDYIGDYWGIPTLDETHMILQALVKTHIVLTNICYSFVCMMCKICAHMCHLLLWAALKGGRF